MRHPLLFLLLVTATLLLEGCLNRPACGTENTTDLKLAFISLNSGKDSVHVFQQIQSGSGIVLAANTNKARYTVAVNPGSDSTLFLFKSSQVDSLWVNYSRLPYLKSEECGMEVEYGGLKIIYSTFDSVRVKNQKLNLQTITNIEIYQ